MPTARESVDLERMRELVRYASSSREARRQAALRWSRWYETGTEEGPPAVYNKLLAHLDRLQSYLYAPETVRFSIHLPPDERAEWLAAAEIARDELRLRWTDSGADLVVAALIEWALVWGATVAKVQPDPQRGFRVGFIAPWDFGVSREDLDSLDEQDVCCHWYQLSLPQVERWVVGQPDEADLLALARRYARPPGGASSPYELWVTGAQPAFPNTVISALTRGDAPEMLEAARPMVEEPVVEFVDVWERCLVRKRALGVERTDVFEDWMVATLVAEPLEPFWPRRRNPDLPWTRIDAERVMPGELPFVLMVPRPTHRYLWGRSELGRLTRLQVWREEHLRTVKGIIERQMDPAKFFSGLSNVEEAERALSTPGGAYGSPDPGAKMQPIVPPLTPEAFAFVGQLDQMFDDASGLPAATRGEVAPGVRSQAQLLTQAAIGGGRVRRAALTVEAILGLIATRAFHLLQRHDPRRYRTADGQAFLLSQLPPDTSVLVQAHSASPVFAEQVLAKAALLQRAGALTLDDLVELVDPPNREELKAHARALAQQRAEASRAWMQIQAQRAQSRPPGRPPGPARGPKI